jgi:hypothetical protein
MAFIFLCGLVAFIVQMIVLHSCKHHRRMLRLLPLVVMELFPACIVSKRTHFSRRRAGKQHYSRSSTNYYVTFQLGSGDRMELRVSGEEYGFLVEGDRGELSFQGSRYIGFERS